MVPFDLARRKSSFYAKFQDFLVKYKQGRQIIFCEVPTLFRFLRPHPILFLFLCITRITASLDRNDVHRACADAFLTSTTQEAIYCHIPHHLGLLCFKASVVYPLFSRPSFCFMMKEVRGTMHFLHKIEVCFNDALTVSGRIKKF